MNPYERFFQFLYTIVGMVVNRSATIDWLNACFEAITNSPEEVPSLPPRIRSSRRFDRGFYKKRIKRKVVSWELSKSDWSLLLEFCRNKNQRFLPLVEYFQANHNLPTTRRVLNEKGFISEPFHESFFQHGINTPLLKAGINIGLRTFEQIRNKGHASKVRFCILKVEG